MKKMSISNLDKSGTSLRNVHTDASLWLYVENGTIIQANRGSEVLLGKQPETLVGQPLLSLVHTADRRRLSYALGQRLTAPGDETTQRVRILTASRGTRSVDIRVTALLTGVSSTYSVYITLADDETASSFNDISADTLYRNVVELSPYGIVTMNAIGVVTSVNTAFAELTGYPIESIKGKHFAKLPTLRLRDIPQYLGVFRTMLQQTGEGEVEFRWKHRDGSLRWGIAHTSILHVDGRAQGLQAILREVTERKRHEMLLNAMNLAANAMLSAVTPDDIYKAVAEVFRPLGFKYAVFQCDAAHRYLSPHYLTYAPQGIKAAERILSTSVSDIQLPIERVRAFREVIWNQRTLLVDDSSAEIVHLFDTGTSAIAKQIVQLLDVPKSINAPLTLEDGAIGMMSVQADDLQQSDVPAFTALANQMSAALRQAQLYAQASKELTIRKQAETELDRLQVMLHSISVSMPTMMMAMDEDGIVHLWNEAIEEVTEIPAEQAIGRHFWIAAPYLVVLRELFYDVARTRKSIKGYRVSSTPPNRHYSVRGFPFNTGEMSGVVFYIDDVTDVVAMENSVLQNAKMASVGSLAAGVAHEINNPLAAMMQAAQLVQRSLDTTQASTRSRMAQYDLDTDALERYMASRDIGFYLAGIRETGARAAKIVADLLSFSRRRAFKLAEHSLNEIVLQAVELISTDNGDSRTYQTTDIRLDLADESPVLVCDSQQIQQVVMNIAKNAFQAMQEHAEQDRTYRPELLIQTGEGDGTAQIIIQDNGPGIPEEVRTHLFEPFFTTKEVGEGTGLGLWLCWSIVTEHHRGTIYVDPDCVDGTRFVIALPLDRT